MSPTCLHNMVNFGPLAAEIGLSGIEQRAPPIFGRATITLGIGPHSSYSCFDSSRTIIFISFRVSHRV